MKPKEYAGPVRFLCRTHNTNCCSAITVVSDDRFLLPDEYNVFYVSGVIRLQFRWKIQTLLVKLVTVGCVVVVFGPVFLAQKDFSTSVIVAQGRSLRVK
jgi:hypothetical protein